MDKYRNFKQLRESETEGVDYVVFFTSRKESSVAVIAPHGGKIEPRTAEFAEAIAGDDFNLYCFKGIKEKRNCDLHITSRNFDEPKCLSLLETQNVVVALHGCDRKGEHVLLGGRNNKLIAELAEALKAVGISAETSGHEFTGTDAVNICNRGATHAGAQFELSMSFRKGPNGAKFVEAVRDVLKKRQNAA